MERRDLARRLGARAVTRAPRVLIAESNPEKFMQAFAEAAAGEGEVFLGNPAWSVAERAQVEALLAHEPAGSAPGDEGWLMIPTGGSSGVVKFARHDSHTLAAAVEGFCRHFGLARVNALGGLPLYHVSGLMAWMRCQLTGGVYLSGNWKEIEAGLQPDLPELPDGWVISLVPTQLERLLRDETAVQWLRQFRVILLGGAPATADLLDRAAQPRLRLAPSYGMTETAAMIAALRPEEFLAGTRSSGTAMPHARIETTSDGVVRVASSANFRGYFPSWREAGTWFETADLGEVDANGHLRVRGRRDAAIITGGEKVQPAEVEAVLQAATRVAEVAVVGVPDVEWGQRIVAVFPETAPFAVEAARAAAQAQLSPHQRPKAYLALAEWPRNAAGKLNRPRLLELATAALRADSNREPPSR